MSELFDIPESLSPRLAWLKEHDLTVTRLENGKYECALEDLASAIGETADEACVEFCLVTGLRHWTHEYHA